MKRNLTRKFPKFLGVWPKDKIHSLRTSLANTDYPVCYIVNTHTSKLPGEHWIAFYWRSPSDCEFFDSYAQPPATYDLAPTDPNVVISSNSLHLQSFDSDACGHHCIWYIIFKANGHTMYDFQKSYLTGGYLKNRWQENLIDDVTLKQNDALAKLRVLEYQRRLSRLHRLSTLSCPSDSIQCCKSRDTWCKC